VDGEVGRAELQGRARDVLASVERLDGLAEALRRWLPRLANPRDEADFQEAVEGLAGSLDEAAVHRLGMLAAELWLYRDAAARQPVPQPPPVVQPVPPSVPLEPSPAAPAELLDMVVDIASYLAAAAAGGVIGNRTDAVVRRLIGKVRVRLRKRTDDRQAPLDAEEAADVARAAALVQGYSLDRITELGAEPLADGSWLVRLSAGRETLRVTVPPGDPARARILIY
jgi:hypothetical protein